jgi:hypothetical protein
MIIAYAGSTLVANWRLSFLDLPCTITGKERTEQYIQDVVMPTQEQLMGTPELDQGRVQQFGQKMVAVMNSAALALMSSIGHQTSLFDSVADLPPATSQQIATTAKLNERYVREWLNAMVASHIVEYYANASRCEFCISRVKAD